MYHWIHKNDLNSIRLDYSIVLFEKTYYFILLDIKANLYSVNNDVL